MTPALSALLLTAVTARGLASIVALPRGAAGEDLLLTNADDAHKTTREKEVDNRVFSGVKSPILPRRGVLSTSGVTPAASADARRSAPDTAKGVREDSRREKKSKESHHQRQIEAVSARGLGNFDDSEYHMMNDNNDDDDNDAEEKDDVVIATATTTTAAATAAAGATYRSIAAGRGEEKSTPMHRVPLQNMDNVQYFGQVMIGEPPQLMKV